jgi:signal transduction histidine kinase
VRTLFLRVFLTLWVAMAVVSAGLIVSSPLFTRGRPAVERWQERAERYLHERVDDAAGHLSRGETDHDGDREGRGPGHLWVFAPGGALVAGSEVSEEATELAAKVAARGEQLSERDGPEHLLARPVVAPDGKAYVVVASVRRPPSVVDLLEPRALGWRLGIFTLVVGVLSLWLARRWSRPVEALRATVRRIADGDLAARVTERIARRRDEVGDLATDFNTMAARLEALLAAQRRLLRDASHELRSPLARLEVALELARQHASSETGELLDRIGRESERLESLIAQLLTLSRLESTESARTSEAVDLGELTRALAEDAAFEASTRSVSVEAETDDDVVVRGDPDDLSSAVENVLRNAVRYTAEGSAVRLTLARDAGEGVVRVADHGPGVPDGELARIFDPFYRVEDAREAGAGGTGLGLAIAARVVRLHGGSISARNRDGGGLEVTIRLPLARWSRGRPPPARLQAPGNTASINVSGRADRSRTCNGGVTTPSLTTRSSACDGSLLTVSSLAVLGSNGVGSTR